NGEEGARGVDKPLEETPKGARGSEQRTKVVRAGLEAAPRVGEEFAKRMLAEALPAYDALPEPKEPGALLEQAAFLEKALFLAGHYGRIDNVHPLVARFRKMLQTQRGPQAVAGLDSLAGAGVRGLREAGGRRQIRPRLAGEG